MGREGGESPFDPIHLATEDDLHALQQNPAQACCTAATFKIDLIGTTKSSWNVNACRIFVRSFQDQEYDCRIREEIESAFFNHVKSLKTKLQKENIGEQELQASARTHAKNQRKLTVSPCIERLHSLVIDEQ